jgi:hypothetical protein
LTVYGWAQEAQVDWYEAWDDLGDERTRVQVFAMRSMASGAAFHRAYLHATQQAFLEAHELAFAYFGGVFRLLRYDNLASAVRKILRGYRREETVRFMAFRSHWRFGRHQHVLDLEHYLDVLNLGRVRWQDRSPWRGGGRLDVDLPAMTRSGNGCAQERHPRHGRGVGPGTGVRS